MSFVERSGMAYCLCGLGTLGGDAAYGSRQGEASERLHQNVQNSKAMVGAQRSQGVHTLREVTKMKVQV